MTNYHAKYYAYELSRIGGSGLDRLGRTLFDACVDLNPHQIEAALFAIRSPISKGVLLADEVGLGKTIEAGLVLCQYWAERRRRLLVICPASLRKQWALELSDKFNLPSFVLDAKTFRDRQRNGNRDPFNNEGVIVCSMHYAANKANDIGTIPWDLVVIDEAHKLRNSYRQSNQIGQKIRFATEDRRSFFSPLRPYRTHFLNSTGFQRLSMSASSVNLRLSGASTSITALIFRDCGIGLPPFADAHCGVKLSSSYLSRNGSSLPDPLDQRIRSTIFMRQFQHI